MATQGLSKPGWNAPTLTSAAVQSVSDTPSKEYDDGKSTEADTKRPDDPEAGLPLSDVSIKDDEVVDPNEQAGVQKVEAVTLTWSKRSLRLIYIK